MWLQRGQQKIFNIINFKTYISIRVFLSFQLNKIFCCLDGIDNEVAFSIETFLIIEED